MSVRSWVPLRRGRTLPPRRNRFRGASLIVTLLMLAMLTMIGLSAAQIAFQEEKASRNERDREIAMHAAEAALTDAELDIESSSRSYLFAPDKSEGFAASCSNGQVDIYLGLCRQAGQIIQPIWQTVDFSIGYVGSPLVPYGHFTGRTLPTQGGPLPIHAPRYLIELMSDNSGATGSSFYYQITAIGFGSRDSTQVVLQTLYRKAGSGGKESMMPIGRFSWREIPNWKELRDALT